MMGTKIEAEKKLSSASKHRSKYHRPRQEINRVLKYLIFLINFVFVLCGVTSLGLGVYLYANEFRPVLEAVDFFLNPAILLIAGGVIIGAISLLGCMGALRENVWMLKMFSLSLFFCYIILVIIAFVIFILFYSDTSTGISIQTLLLSAVKKYHTNDNYRDFMDYLQVQLTDVQNRVYTDGCLHPLQKAFEGHAVIIGAMVGAIIIPVCLSVTFSNILAKQVDRQRYLLEKEARREDRRRRRARHRFRDPFAQIFTPPRRRNRENPYYTTVDETGGPEISISTSKENFEPQELEPTRLMPELGDENVAAALRESRRPRREKSPTKRRSLNVDKEAPGRSRSRQHDRARSRSPLRKTSAPAIVMARDVSPPKEPPRRKQRRKKSTEQRKMRKSMTEPVLMTATPSAPLAEQFHENSDAKNTDGETSLTVGAECLRVVAEEGPSASGNNSTEAKEIIDKSKKMSL